MRKDTYIKSLEKYMKNIENTRLRSVLSNACLIRGIEKGINQLGKEYVLKGPIHTCNGSELIPTCVSAISSKGDFITSTHRGHGHFLAHGGLIEELLDELIGLETGACQGRGGSMHVAKPEIGIVGANGIVGGGASIACGCGLGIKLDKKENIVICYFGDGAINQGVLLESLNMAAAIEIPVLFICENNQIAQTTFMSEVSKTKPYIKAKGMGIESRLESVNKIQQLMNTIDEANETVRFKKKPFFIEVEYLRQNRHFATERPFKTEYLKDDYLKQLKSQDPIREACNELSADSNGISSEIDSIANDVVTYVDQRIK